MKHLLILSLMLSGGCAFAPKNETARFVSDLSYEDSINNLINFTNKCWVKEGKGGGDSVYTKTSKTSEGNFEIIIGRDNFDIPFKPFATIELVQSDGKIQYIIKEGSTVLMKKRKLDESLAFWNSNKGSCYN